MSTEGAIFVYCDTCGDLIRHPVAEEGIIARCRRCRVECPVFCGNTNPARNVDDLSGKSGSWDMAVKLMEGDFDASKP